MKFGVNMQIWDAPYNDEHISLVKKVKEMGFDFLELAIDDIHSHFNRNRLREVLKENDLEVVICSSLDSAHDITSHDRSVRENGIEFIKGLIKICGEIGAKVLCGPLYAEVFRRRFLNDNERRKEREICINSLKAVAPYAQDGDVTLALEPLVRFETDLINTSEQAVELLEKVDHPNIKLHLDTFHMNVEEESIPSAIRIGAKYLVHFHACESHRGVPGTGHIPWFEVARTLREIEYKGAIAVESYNPHVSSIANAACIWRQYAADPDSFALQSISLFKAIFI